MDFLDLDDMEIYHVSTTPSPSSSGVSWRFAEEFQSIPYSDIELADQERKEKPDGSNIEHIFRDSSLSNAEVNNDVQSSENYPLGDNDSVENPWRMGFVLSEHALHWHHSPAARFCCGRYTPRFIEHPDGRKNDGINYMFLSLSIFIHFINPFREICLRYSA